MAASDEAASLSGASVVGANGHRVMPASIVLTSNMTACFLLFLGSIGMHERSAHVSGWFSCLRCYITVC